MTQDKEQQKPPCVVFCCPTLKGPYQQFKDALEAEAPHLDAAGLDHKLGWELGCPYISNARATLLRRALDAGADIVVFLDHDLSWRPGDLTKLVRTAGDVVAGLYRFKTPDEDYMGTILPGPTGYPIEREDGAIKAARVPGGFLKITRGAVQRFMQAYPELIYGDMIAGPHVDLFNHGAHKGVWWGEDYAFSRRWREMGGDIWVVPDLDLTHHDREAGDFPGNIHRFLLKPDDEIKEAA